MASSGVGDLTGRVLAGRYRLLAPIGAGASGRVYVADDTRLRRRVAVKVLHLALAEDAGSSGVSGPRPRWRPASTTRT